MDMQGNTLFLFTSRTMFELSSVVHQSNISFKINTDNMTIDTDAVNAPYVSHSFQQFVKFKDNTLHTLDHGDAHPRGLFLNVTTNYDGIPYTQTWNGEDGEKIFSTTKHDSISKIIFNFQGDSGDNYTACTVGGMEIGEKNILVCGIAQPHNKKVAGVSGIDADLRYNLFLSLCDRKTGKRKFKWLTKYNPKTSKELPVKIGVVNMVKLSDSRFAVLYTTLHYKKIAKQQYSRKVKLHYIVVTDTGEKIYSKTYSDFKTNGEIMMYHRSPVTVGFDDGVLNYESEPVLYNGNIIWTSLLYGKFTKNREEKNRTKIYSIPAVY